MKQRNSSNYNLGIILGLFLPAFGILLVLLLIDDQDIKDGALKGFVIALSIGLILELFMIIVAGGLPYSSYYALAPILAI